MVAEPDSVRVILQTESVCPFHPCVCVSIHPGHTQLEKHHLPVRACQFETGVVDGLVAVGAPSERVHLS